jgi:hypothetical protein
MHMKKMLALVVLAAAAVPASADVVITAGSFPLLAQGFSQPVVISASSYNSTDFYVNNYTDFSNGGSFQQIYVPWFPGKVMTTGGFSTNGYALAKKLSIGDEVGPATFASASFNPLLATQTFGQGQWYNGTQAVEGAFGLAFANGFDGNGNSLVNYAFVDVKVTPLAGQSASVEIIGWGYQTKPNTALNVEAIPEPTGLGGLALAAATLTRRRRA